jgi:TolA-binding protein
MKRTERQHLKENELQTFARQARGAYEGHQRETMALVAFLAVAAVAAVGYFAWRENVEAKAHALLADAVAVRGARVGPPPAPGQPDQGLRFATERERAQTALTKFKVSADAYPSTDAGIYARYQQAATYMTLDDATGAAAAYQQVIDKDGDGIYGQMARLGLAEAQAHLGRYDDAIKAFQAMAQRKDGPLPIDAILMQLGRTYVEAGRRAEAQQTFNRLVQEFPESTFGTDARHELDNLKKT